MAIEDIDHTRTKARSPQTNGICERFHKTVLDEFYRIAFRKRIYATIEQLQGDPDAWMTEYNQVRSHQFFCFFASCRIGSATSAGARVAVAT